MNHLELIKKEKLFEAKSVLAVAVSGGADSMALLHCLTALRWSWRLDLRAVHIHHGLREASDHEAEFVEKFCNERAIPFEMMKVEVKPLMDQGMSLEEAARVARHKVFKDYAASENAMIALGHHMEDQAETVLLNLFRGSGALGLKGMLPKRDYLCRPLLTTSKSDILAYCKEFSIDYVTDESNSDVHHKRNYLRHKIIPKIQHNVQPEVIKGLCTTAAILREDEAYLSQVTDNVYKALVFTSPNEGTILYLNEFESQPMAIKRRLLRKIYKEVAKGLTNLSYEHVERMMALAEHGNTGKVLELPKGIRVCKSYNKLYVTETIQEDKPKGKPEPLNIETLVMDAPVNVGPLQLRLMAYEKGASFPKNVYTKWFDYDRIKNTLILRNREPGDYIFLGSECFKKKLKNYFIDNKIPAKQRGLIPLLASESEVLWIVGHRMSEAYKINETTKTVLEIAFIKEDYQ